MPTIAFCVDTAHSQLVAERFRSRGHRATHIDGNTPALARRAAIEALATGEIEVSCNCGLISEGVDVPSIGAAILLRPAGGPRAACVTGQGKSAHPRFRRQCLAARRSGRAARLDFGSKVDEGQGAGAEAGVSPLSGLFCPPRNAIECIACSSELAMTRAERAEIHAELVQAQRVQLIGELRDKPRGEQLEWAGADPERLSLVASVRGYKRGWVWHRKQELEGASAIG